MNERSGLLSPSVSRSDHTIRAARESMLVLKIPRREVVVLIE
jgi:hypothetical protein